MNIQHGEYRIVLMIPSRGVVIKIPRVDVVGCASVLRRHVREVRNKTATEAIAKLVKVLKRGTAYELSPQRLLFKGLVDNLREWRFSRSRQSDAVAPVLLWLPFLSVHRYAPALSEAEGEDLYVRLYAEFGEKTIMKDPHHFRNPKNFGILDGHLVMVDYASPAVQAFLAMHGNLLIHSFRYNT